MKANTGSIRKRGNRWEVTIDTGQVDAQGKRIRKYGKADTKAEAERIRREMIYALETGQLVTTKLTVAEWMAKWLEVKVNPSDRKPNTKLQYAQTVRRHITPNIGRTQLGDLTLFDIEALYAKLRVDLSPNSISCIHQVLKGGLQEAVRQGLIPRNPASNAQTPKRKPYRMELPSVDRIKDLLGLAATEGHELYAAMHLAAFTGMRRGEILGLRWQNVNTATGQIRVQECLIQTGEGKKFGPPKSESSERIVELDPVTVKVLEGHRERQDRHIQSMKGDYLDTGLLFTNATGEPKPPNTLSRVVKNLGKRVGIENLRLHDLRHFHASLLIKQGMDLPTISARLGHSSTAVTAKVYVHSMPGRQREAADMFAAAMGAGPNVGHMSAIAPKQAEIVSETAVSYSSSA